MSKIARLRHRVALQKYIEIQNPYSGTYKRWVSTTLSFAEIIAIKGLSIFAMQQINKAITHKITIRYQDNITSENWVLLEGRRFRIRNIRNLKNKNRYLELLCEEFFTEIEFFQVGKSATGDHLSQIYISNPFLLTNYFTFLLLGDDNFDLL